MIPSVFHPFARLPVELRLQIWEAACVRFPASHRGLQYIDVRDGEAVPIACDWPKAPGQFTTTNSNRSAYLIDGGLWRACKESRERAIVDSKPFHKYSAAWSGVNESPHPAIIDACEGEEECRMVVFSANDIFCLQVDDWTDLKMQGSVPDISTSLIRHKRDDRADDRADDHEYDYEYDIRLPGLQKLHLENIGLEFDSSWLVDLPDHIYDMAYENSTRGYLANFLKEKADYLSLFTTQREGMWIVDKRAGWYNNADTHHDTIYRDCDGEYIEVYCNDLADSYSSDGEFPNAATFLRELVILGFDDCFSVPASPGRSMGPWNPEPKDEVRLLVRRDYQAKEVAGRCKNKCFRIGRCICDEVEGDWWEDEDEDMDVELS
ncbi:hypothetical protein FGRMN_1765 [Fusarium graminum]|nr:hypothetical protein FGRMN_1765 [Fusarium graminum]